MLKKDTPLLSLRWRDVLLGGDVQIAMFHRGPERGNRTKPICLGRMVVNTFGEKCGLLHFQGNN